MVLFGYGFIGCVGLLKFALFHPGYVKTLGVVDFISGSIVDGQVAAECGVYPRLVGLGLELMRGHGFGLNDLD